MEITEQRENKIPYAALFNEMPDAVVITDQGGRIKDLNMRAIELLGQTPAEVLDLHVFELINCNLENPLDQVLQDLENTRYASCDAFCTPKKGLPFPADVVVTRITFGSDSTLYFFIRDATRRKQNEETLRNSSRIRSLHMLAGSVAHDFNNMLTSIVGHIELALTTISAKSRASEDLATALTDARRMTELSRRMLEYSGKGVLDKSKVDLDAILKSAADKLKGRIAKQVSLKVAAAYEPVTVNGERDLLETAIGNVLINAVEAVEKTGGSVTAYCSIENVDADMLVSTFVNSDLAPGAYACLTITDTGYGMDDIILGRIFDPFFSTKGSGRGLGLPETQGIILSHAGTIAVSTQAGQGATFRILLPVFKDTPKKKAPTIIPTLDDNQKHTILVIDDDSSVRRYTGRIIEKMGFTTLAAENGEDGINLFRLHADEIDLVIVDMFMPRLNGDEVLRNIRKIRPGIKVMIISGYTETIFMERFKDDKPSGFLYKPFVTGDFVDKITEILKA